MAVCLNPCFIAQQFNRRAAAAAHIVPQAEGMANFVAQNNANQVTHKRVGKLHFPCVGVNGASLQHIPVVQQLHYIMVPANMAFQYFAAAGVMYIGAISILDIRRKIPYYAKTGIFHAHRRVVLRPVFGHDGIFKTCFFKGHLPVVNCRQ